MTDHLLFLFSFNFNILTRAQSIRNAAGILFDKGIRQRQSIVPLIERLRKREGELRAARADILELVAGTGFRGDGGYARGRHGEQSGF